MKPMKIVLAAGLLAVMSTASAQQLPDADAIYRQMGVVNPYGGASSSNEDIESARVARDAQLQEQQQAVKQFMQPGVLAPVDAAQQQLKRVQELQQSAPQHPGGDAPALPPGFGAGR